MTYYKNIYEISNYNQILKAEQRVRKDAENLIKDVNDLESKLVYIKRATRPENENWNPLKFRHTSQYYENQRYFATKEKKGGA